jgi:SAM-dependent methyltransferase
MFDSVRKNRFGFYELAGKPDNETLRRFYSEFYYPKGGPTHFEPDEIRYRNHVFDLRYHIIDSFVRSGSLGRRPRMLDVGCGEGWAMQYFLCRGWEICGADYSEYAIAQNCPECLEHFIPGDIYAVLDRLAGEGRTFDCIWLDNVLEHVPEPFELSCLLNRLLSDEGVMMIRGAQRFFRRPAHPVGGRADRPTLLGQGSGSHQLFQSRRSGQSDDGSGFHPVSRRLRLSNRLRSVQ